MREVLDELLQWWREGESVAMATVVATWRSAPRPAGASMLVGPDGSAVGSVSGGCVEGAVYEMGQDCLATTRPELQRYGVSDNDAFAVGLTCGGILDIYVEHVSRETFPELEEIAECVAAGRPVAIATVIEHPDEEILGRRILVYPADPAEGGKPCGASAAQTHVLTSRRADEAVLDDARGLLANGDSATLSYGPDGQRRGEGMRVFVQCFAPKPRFLVFGAIDFAAAVARMGVFLGYHVTVCDARAIFATASRFPDAHEVVVKWPHKYLQSQIDAGLIDERTVMAVLTHDPKFDGPLLQLALGLDVAYIGAMGSRRTHEDRLNRLRELGVSEEQLATLHSPIGLDLGARTPEETAVSIAAEIISLRWGGAGQPLGSVEGPIHHNAHR